MPALAPKARQRPVHEVGKPSKLQLPLNASRTSPVIRNSALAALWPAYQSHGGE